MNEFEECLKNGRILKIDVTNDMIDKEIKEAEYDLIKAKESMLKNDSKWASVQSYYSMFHSAKALVFHKGYREKSHYCLIIALRELYVKNKELDSDFVENLELCMDVRQEADYGLSYDEESAEICIDAAQSFYEKAKEILSNHD